MRDIRNMYGVDIPMQSANLPGTPGYDASFMLNGKQSDGSQQSFSDRFALDHTAGRTAKHMKGYKGDPGDASAMEAWAVNQGYTGNANIPQQTAAVEGAKSDQFEGNRSILPGNEQTAGTIEPQDARPNTVPLLAWVMTTDSTILTMITAILAI